jgi:hypothetical protein
MVPRRNAVGMLRRSTHEAKRGTPERLGGIPTPELGNEIKSGLENHKKQK